MEQILAYIENMATMVPLEVFAFFGTIAEEILAPIPSPLVLSLSGTITAAQGNTLPYILWIAILGALGRVVGSWVIYFIGDKAEDVIVGGFGKFIGLTHKNVERIGAKFTGTAKDYLTLTLLRAIPVLPSSPISGTCGIIKLDLKVFTISTFVGSVFRNIFFLYIGYTGLIASQDLMSGIDTLETVGKILFLIAIGIGLLYLYRQRSKDKLL